MVGVQLSLLLPPNILTTLPSTSIPQNSQVLVGTDKQSRVLTLPLGSVVKNSPDNAGDAGSILESGRFPWRKK